MKIKQFFLQALGCLLLAFCPLASQAQVQEPTDDHEETRLTDNPPAGVAPLNFNAAGQPKVEIALDQLDAAGNLLYHPVAPWTGSKTATAQLSVVVRCKNNEAQAIKWQKTRLEYTQGGPKFKEFTNPKAAFNPGKWQAWQNSRDYHEVGEIVYFDTPIPTKVTIKVYFEGFNIPITITKNIKPYATALSLPFKAHDLESNEVWSGGSQHGGGGQVFAYDMGVAGFHDGVWSGYLPGKDDSKNENYRIWGKPIYAMADGVVTFSLNNVPTNPKPGVKFDRKDYPNSGGGNCFKIQHGELMALYAHMQTGSLNPSLLAVGSVVKKGEFLGLAGNSGNSSGPHLHIHVVKQDGIDGDAEFRPLIFDNGYVIDKTALTGLDNNADWAKLNKQGLPGYGTKRCYVWPGPSKPYYGPEVYTGVFRAGTDGHYMFAGLTETAFVAKNTELKGKGVRLSDMSISTVGGNVRYTGVWRAGTGKTALQTGTTWAAFTTEWGTLSGQGHRLIDLEVFTEDGQIKYAGVYGAGTDGHFLLAGLSKAAFEAKNTEFSGQGTRLIDIEVYKDGNDLKYAGVWRQGSGNHDLVHATSWSAFTDQWTDLSKSGLRLIDVDICKDGNTTHYSGVFRTGTDSYVLWQSNWNSFVSKWDELSKQGLRLVDVNVR